MSPFPSRHASRLQSALLAFPLLLAALSVDAAAQAWPSRGNSERASDSSSCSSSHVVALISLVTRPDSTAASRPSE